MCKGCNENKPVEAFSIGKAKCKLCQKNQRIEKKKELTVLYNDKESREKTMKECIKCKETKNLLNFAQSSVTKGGFKNTCKSCVHDQTMAYNYSLDGHLTKLCSTAKISAKHRESVGRNDESHQCTITVDYLKDLWNKQNGKCFYSDIDMNYESVKWRASLERRDSYKGYTPENVVLCCIEFNGARQWSHEKIKKMIELKKNDDGKMIDIDLIKDKKHDMFFHLKSLLHSSKTRSNKFEGMRKNKTGIFDLDIDFMINLYARQKGRCAYSGLPLQYGGCSNCDWVASLERMNTSVNYIKSNVCLICTEFNCTDNSVKYYTMPEEGMCGWNKEKFQTFYHQICSEEYQKKHFPEYTSQVNATTDSDADTNSRNNNIVRFKCLMCQKDLSEIGVVGHRTRCDECEKIHKKNVFEQRNMNSDIEKTCIHCKEKKFLSDFTTSSGGRHGCENVCKVCKSIQQKMRNASTEALILRA